jgi:hypothetical protein
MDVACTKLDGIEYPLNDDYRLRVRLYESGWMYREENIVRQLHFGARRCLEHGRAPGISIMALHRQNAELNCDIASVLSEHVCEPLDEEIEHLASLLASSASHSRQAEARV